jgi:predicted TIM-barrel fold metal-dependent hydrolase
MTQAAPIIDLHSHWFPPSTLEILGSRTDAPRFQKVDGGMVLQRPAGGGVPGGAQFPVGVQWFDIDARLTHMDEVGVAHQLISWPTTLGIDAALGADATLPLWRAWNDDVSALIRRHPDRFSAVAALSTSDIAWSVRELERAHETLGMIGGVLPVGGVFSPEAARHLAPIFEAAQRYRSHIYLHTGWANPAVPGQPPIPHHSDDSIVRWVIGSAYQFASGVATLAYTDFLDAYPDITVQFAMLGGTALGALAAEQAGIAGFGRKDAFRQIWLDTGAAGSGTAAIASAIRVLGAERIVFGTDFAPMPTIAPTLARVRAAFTSADEADLVLSHNARDLLARHGKFGQTPPTLPRLQTGELV